MRLDKVRKVDCCREGTILIEYASYRTSFTWLRGDTDNLEIGWWMYFKNLHTSIGLNIVVCPFCGTPVPDVWEGSEVIDYIRLEDAIIHLGYAHPGPKEVIKDTPEEYKALALAILSGETS